MASPIPILVSPSTTVVQVNPLLSPYTPVILNSYSYAGQLVTIADGTSSFGVLATPIVVSTASTQFSDGSVSTLINQPRGTITAQAGPMSWSVLNSFPFRGQYLSAGVQNLNVSTLYTSSLSTLQEFTSTLVVENLFVSGNFSQGSGLVLNQTISTLGNVDLFSSITVWQSTFVSSGVSTLGKVSFASSLTVQDNLITPSTVRFLSSVSAASGSVIGYLSTSLVRLGTTLDTNRLLITGAIGETLDIGGDVFVSGRLESASNLTSGSNLTSFITSVGALSTLSSLTLVGPVFSGSNTVFHGNVSTQKTLGVAQNLSVGKDIFLQGDLTAQDITVRGSTFIHGLVSTGNVFAEQVSIPGNLQVNPTLTNPTPIGFLTVTGPFGVGSIESISTTIGGALSTPALFFAQGSIFAQSSMTVKGAIVTASSFSTLGDLYSLSSLSNVGNVFVSSSVRVDGSFTGSFMYWNQSNISSSYIANDLSILGNLTVTQTMKLSSITLVSSVLANSFQTSTLATAYQGIVSSVFVSSLRTSSLGTGGILYPAFTMDMSNDFQTVNLSTFLLSSLQFLAQSEGTFAPSTFFEATTGFGVRTIASTNTFDVNTIAYTLCNTTVLRVLSTNAVFGDSIMGSLRGDGRLLSNVSYPAGISTSLVETSSLKGLRIHADGLFLSTMVADNFTVVSTLTIGQIGFYGESDLIDLSQNPLSNLLHVAAPLNRENLLFLNTLSIYGNSADTVTKQVVLNSNTYTLPIQNPYTLAANSIRVSTINSSNFSLPLFRVNGDILMVNSYTTNSLYVSSGRVGLSPGLLFLPEGQPILTRSTNTIQPFLSTLSFNSTLFLNLNTSSVGVNTFPTYKLDVNSVTYAPNGVEVYQSTLVTNLVNVKTVQQNAASLAVGASTLQTNGSATFYRQVQFFNNAAPSFLATYATPYIAYDSTSLQMNKVLKLDANNNVVVDYSGDLSAFQSTFYTGGSTIVSGFLSTGRLTLSNGYFLSMQNI
jgi:hypothetical protein